jgi:Ca2+/Na+ antiporter
MALSEEEKRELRSISFEMVKLGRADIKGLQDKVFTLSPAFLAGSFAVSAFLIKEQSNFIMAILAGMFLLIAVAVVWWKFIKDFSMSRAALEIHESNLKAMLKEKDVDVDVDKIVTPSIDETKVAFPLKGVTKLLLYTEIVIAVQMMFVSLYLFMKSQPCCCRLFM